MALLTGYPLLSQSNTASPRSTAALWRALWLTTALFVVFEFASTEAEIAGVLASLVVIAFFYFGIFSGDVFRESLTAWIAFRSGSDRRLWPPVRKTIRRPFSERSGSTSFRRDG